MDIKHPQHFNINKQPWEQQNTKSFYQNKEKLKRQLQKIVISLSKPELLDAAPVTVEVIRHTWLDTLNDGEKATFRIAHSLSERTPCIALNGKRMKQQKDASTCKLKSYHTAEATFGRIKTCNLNVMINSSYRPNILYTQHFV